MGDIPIENGRCAADGCRVEMARLLEEIGILVAPWEMGVAEGGGKKILLIFAGIVDILPISTFSAIILQNKRILIK